MVLMPGPRIVYPPVLAVPHTPMDERTAAVAFLAVAMEAIERHRATGERKP